jgi:hypothetical protein
MMLRLRRHSYPSSSPGEGDTLHDKGPSCQRQMEMSCHLTNTNFSTAAFLPQSPRPTFNLIPTTRVTEVNIIYISTPMIYILNIHPNLSLSLEMNYSSNLKVFAVGRK